MDNGILVKYVAIAETEDLRTLALEYAVDHDWGELEIVTLEIEKRVKADKAETQTNIKVLDNKN
jgi:hypothetical protein